MKGCIAIKSKKRLFDNGWTYSEAHRIYRERNRESKLEGWSIITFKEWINGLITIGATKQYHNKSLQQYCKTQKYTFGTVTEEVYDWRNGERVAIMEAVNELVPNEVYLYKTYNFDRNDYGALTTGQFK